LAGHHQSAVFDPLLLDREALHAHGFQVQYAELRHVPVGDAGQAADFLGDCGSTHLLAFLDQTHAKRPVVTQAILGHVHVALLEYPQRQQSAGKQHGIQRKDGDFQGVDAAVAVEQQRQFAAQPGVYLGHERSCSPQRGISSWATPRWSRMRATTKSTMSETLCG